MGNVDYKFNIILTDTTATDNISYDYIMTQVGKLDPISLSSTTSNIIKSDMYTIFLFIVILLFKMNSISNAIVSIPQDILGQFEISDANTVLFTPVK